MAKGHFRKTGSVKTPACLKNIRNLSHMLHFVKKCGILIGNPEKKGGGSMQLQESGEMYLEAIYVLSTERPFVRSVDVSEYLGYSKPSVSRAVGLLKAGAYITVDQMGGLNLTPSGLEIAKKIYERHTILTELLVMLGVSRETAAADACRLEHAISDESFAAIKEHLRIMGKKNPG